MFEYFAYYVTKILYINFFVKIKSQQSLRMSARYFYLILIAAIIGQTECLQCYDCKGLGILGVGAKDQGVCDKKVNCGTGACVTDITKEPYVPSCATRVECKKKEDARKAHCCYDDFCNSSHNAKPAFFTAVFVFTYSLCSLVF